MKMSLWISVTIIYFGFYILPIRGQCSFEESVGFVCRNITNISDMKLAAYEYPPNAVTIINSDISIIESNTFRNKLLYTLEELDIFNCTTTTLDQFAFKGLIKLRLLYLENNNITTIRRNAFFGLVNVVYLNLQHNNIATVTSASLSGLVDLTDLNLADNVIENIDVDSFNYLLDLESIDLSHNRLTMLDPMLLKNKTNLEYISFAYNDITIIPEYMFENVTNLRTLRLDNNYITELKRDVFAGLENLENLYLQNNNIHTVEVYCFKFWWYTGNLNNLVYLDMSHNNLTTQIWCSKCSKLKELKLNHNRLSSYTIDITHHLELLDLSYNEIKTIIWRSTNKFRYKNLSTFTVNLLSNPLTNFGISEIPLLLLHLRLKIKLNQRLLEDHITSDFAQPKYKKIFEFVNNDTESCTTEEIVIENPYEGNNDTENLVFVNEPDMEFYPQEIEISGNCTPLDINMKSVGRRGGLYSGRTLLWTSIGSVVLSCIITNIIIFVICKLKLKEFKTNPENMVELNSTVNHSASTVHL